MRSEEAELCQKKCYGIYLYTYSFQNPGFYEKFGYHVFGTLENFCNNHSKIYMKKILKSQNQLPSQKRRGMDL